MIGTKGLGYHSFTHDDGEGTVQCELCTFVVQQEFQEYFPPAQLDFPVNATFFQFEGEISGTAISYSSRLSPDRLFSRPPPVWV